MDFFYDSCQSVETKNHVIPIDTNAARKILIDYAHFNYLNNI